MPAIFPIATNRVSDVLLQQRLLSQFEFDRSELVRLQDQLSTGLRLRSPSDDAPAGLRAIALQRLLEQKQQVKTNQEASESFLAATDNALGGVTDLISNIRAQALSAVDSTTSPGQRDVLIQEIRHAIEQLANIGNRQFRGRYLFAGSATSVRPFELSGSNVLYHGNDGKLQSYADLGLLLETNATGDEVFGAISAERRGSVDLNPILTPRTRLSDLRGGRGIAAGSIQISDGSSSRIIDLASAETLRDVVRLIEASPPDGRLLTVELSVSGLVIDIDDAGGGNLTIREVGGGTTAADLGILETSGVGSGAITGSDLDPRLLPTTRLADILGTRAAATLEAAGAHNNFRIEAAANGAQFNGVLVQFVNNVAAGDQAFVNYDSVAKTLSLDVAPGATTAATVVQAVNDHGLFTAALSDEPILDNDGSGLVDVSLTAVTAGGSGISLDQTSGLQITNGGQTHTIDIAGEETVEGLLNRLNASPAQVLAVINPDGTGIDIRSRLSGTDFQIGENGGTTATDLGVRTFSRDTRLDELNFGRGVDVAAGTDFTIQRKDGVTLEVDVSTATTVGDVIDLINQHPANQDATRIEARLVDFGNGIELLDGNAAGLQNVTVARAGSFAAWDLALVPRGEPQGVAPAVAAEAALAFAPPNDLNSAFRLTATMPGPARNGVAIEIVDSGALSGNQAAASFDAVNQLLRIDVDLGSTTATVAVEAVNAAGLPFTAELDRVADPGNNGSGLIPATGVLATTAGGGEEPFRGADANPLETGGVFNSLIRLSDALNDFDLVEIERAAGMLDDDFERVSFARGSVGARQRSFETLGRRLENEDVELRATLSDEIDADVVAAISELTARQANLEATLRLIGQTLQLTVLDFL